MLSIQGNMLIIIIIVTITMKCTSAVADTFCRNKFHRKYATEGFHIMSFLSYFVGYYIFDLL